MFSLPRGFPGRLVVKVVDRLDYVSFLSSARPAASSTICQASSQIDKVTSGSKILRPILVGILLREGLLPECDLSYKRVDVVSSAVRLRGIAVEGEVRRFILGNRDTS